MKKFLIWLLPAALAACGGMNGVDNAPPSAGADGLAEESLGTANDYIDPQSASAPQADAGLLYAGSKYYIGTPYKIEDIQYSPAEDHAYSQTGTAGIVPAELNGVQTTNGEKFDTNAMIATSKTLPLPSIVRITNMENGQSAVVRVNNRGPFVNSRLMDVSPVAAKKLGMTGQAKVRVDLLADESRKVKSLTLGTMGEVATPAAAAQPVAAPAAGGPYAVQVGAYYSEESANAIANRISGIGSASVVQDGGMYKIRIMNLSEADAKTAIRRLRDEENMAPGLLKDGHWISQH